MCMRKNRDFRFAAQYAMEAQITKFVILNAKIEYFFIGYLFIVMRAAIFSYLSAILKQFNYLRNLFCNIYD